MSKFKGLSLTAKVIIIIAIVLVACLIIASAAYFFIVSTMLSRYYEPDLVISSPDGQHELVVREFSCLGGAGAEIYIRNNSWMIKQIGDVVTDDYYHTFTNGTYYVEWEIDRVTIYYCDGLHIEKKNDPSTWRGMVSYEFE